MKPNLQYCGDDLGTAKSYPYFSGRLTGRGDDLYVTFTDLSRFNTFKTLRDDDVITFNGQDIPFGRFKPRVRGIHIEINRNGFVAPLI